MNLLEASGACASRTRRILIVEDEAVIAMDMAQHLRDFGFEVVGIAANGDRALELAQRERPDLVMMDIVIKGPSDGIDTARRIRAVLDVPVVFLTAYGDQATLERAKQANPHGYLLKPFRPQDLRSMIEVALHRQALERRVHDSERWLQRMLQCIGDGVIATDAGGSVRLMNEVAERLTGCSDAAARGRAVTEICTLQPEQGGDTLAALLGRALAGVPSQPPQRGLLHDASGPRLYVDAGAAAIRGDGGRLLGGVLVLRDVTQRRLDELELARHRDHLEHLVRERTAELEAARAEAERISQARIDFLAAVSHELRTPLNAVLGFAELLGMDTALGQRQGGYVQQISLAGAHLLRVLDDLLDLAKIDAGRMVVRSEPVAVCNVVAQAVAMLQPLAAPAQVTLDGGDVSPRHVVAADASRLRQVLFNLVSNGIKYNRPGGSVRLSSRQLPDGRLRIAVTDSGRGIAPALQQRLFRAFERLDAENGRIGGTGLGLSFSKGLTVLMGGELGLESTPGVGSTFHIDLPAWTGEPPAAAGPAPAPAR